MKIINYIVAVLCYSVSGSASAQFDLSSGYLYLENEELFLGDGVTVAADVLMKYGEDGRFDVVSLSINNEAVSNAEGSTTYTTFQNCAFSVDRGTLEAKLNRSETYEKLTFDQARTGNSENTFFIKGSGDELCGSSLSESFYYDSGSESILKQ